LLISSRAGYSINALGDRMSVYQLECFTQEGKYAVELFENDDDEEGHVKYFRSAEDAALFFETHRRRLRLGFEYEGATA